MSGTGENEMGLKKILDFTRLTAMLLLCLHLYYFCYAFFEGKGPSSEITDRILQNLIKTGILDNFHKTKLYSLALLSISLLGAKGKKSEKIGTRRIFVTIILGLALYFGSELIFRLPLTQSQTTIGYGIGLTLGFVLIMSGATYLTRFIRLNLGKDIFNEQNETFPQEERLLENEYSINLPATYKLKNKTRKSWINVINPFRGLLVCGSPGAGKSYFVIQHIIKQHIRKGYSMLVYDFKYDDLSKIAYNILLSNHRAYKVVPQVLRNQL